MHAVVSPFKISRLKWFVIGLSSKKKVLFMFSERIGFRALYDKHYYPIKPLDFLNDSQGLPEVTKSLLFTFYLADGKANPLPSVGRG